MSWIRFALCSCLAVLLMAQTPYPDSPVITAVDFDWGGHEEDAPGSDNWPVTWAADGHQYMTWGDGGGFGGTNSNGRVRFGVARLEGSFGSQRGYNVFGGVNSECPYDGSFDGKSYGILSLPNGDLYAWWGPGSGATAFTQTRLLRSTDSGCSWEKSSWDLIDFDDTLIKPALLNFGRGYAGARDGYIYSYVIHKYRDAMNIQKGGSPEGGRIYLTRVPIADVFDVTEYEWYSSTNPSSPTWSSDHNDREPVFFDPEGTGWTMSVSYNAPLQRYILATEHSYYFAGKLGLHDAPEPWGPWTTFYYLESGENFGDGSGISGINKSFYWNFSNKWLSGDGKDFVLFYTGTGDGDAWNAIPGSFTATTVQPSPFLSDFETGGLDDWITHE